MSKAGVSVRSGNVEAVTEVKRKRKRVEIVKITVDGPDGQPVEVDAKECTKCGEVKSLVDYYDDRRKPGRKTSACRECKNDQSKQRRSNPEYAQHLYEGTEVGDEAFLRKKCSKCGRVKNLKCFGKRSCSSTGFRSSCKECDKSYSLVTRNKRIAYERVWREKNREKVREACRKYESSNRDKRRQKNRDYHYNNRESISSRKKVYVAKNLIYYRLRAQGRRTMRSALPDRCTHRAGVDKLFLSVCSISKCRQDVHIDHFIPITWGHGGSYIGNIAPIRRNLNLSKNNRHPYEWFDANKDRFNLSESAWNELTATLASQNGLTPSEFRAFVDWCYANKRTVAQTKRDNERYGYKKPSLEIWREATGLQFPIRVDFGTSTQLSVIGERSTPDCGNNPEVTAS